jgi:ubiquinone/menaquinone biosynthesis C-methylase UbiE
MRHYLNSTFQSDNPQDVSALDELPFWSAPFGQLLLETIPLNQNINALDIGFGTGYPVIEIAERSGNSCRIYGVDIWRPGLQRALQKISVHGLQNLKLLLAGAENLPFQDEYFDLITSNNGLNNVQDLGKSLAECFRTCKKGGHLIFTINLPETMKEFYAIFESVLKDQNLENEIEKMKEHIHQKRRPLDEMCQLVQHSGFNVEKKIEKSFSYRFVDGTTMLHYFMIREFFMPSWKEIIPERNVQSVFEHIEGRLNKVSKEKGELILTVPYVCVLCDKK